MCIYKIYKAISNALIYKPSSQSRVSIFPHNLHNFLLCNLWPPVKTLSAELYVNISITITLFPFGIETIGLFFTLVLRNNSPPFPKKPFNLHCQVVDSFIGRNVCSTWLVTRIKQWYIDLVMTDNSRSSRKTAASWARWRRSVWF